MKRIIATLLLLFALVGKTAESAPVCSGVDNTLNPLAGFQQINVAQVVKDLTPLPPGVNVRLVTITVETNAVRYRDDGTAPTTSVGVLVQPGGTIMVCTSSIGSFKVIAPSSTATLDVSYYGY